jgi:hypothetical protein
MTSDRSPFPEVTGEAQFFVGFLAGEWGYDEGTHDG